MQQYEPFFVLPSPGRTLFWSLIGLFIAGLWLAHEIAHRNLAWGIVAFLLIAWLLLNIFHNIKWMIRQWRAWFS